MQKLAALVPGPLKRALRRAFYWPADAVAPLLGRRDGLLPPRGRQFVGGGDFQQIGAEFRRYFVELGGLQPSERVLDVGCGIGRMAVPLTGYLNAQGSYEGFDLVAEGIDWCTREIGARYPNFHFQLADVRNQEYRPRGKCPACEYEFPYPDGAFDFAFVVSVFTHMLPHDVEHYLAEMARVLRAGGRCLATFFLLNEEAQSHIRRGQSLLDFKHHLGTFHTVNPQRPEAAIGYDEPFVLELYRQSGLAVRRPVYYGAWCGRPAHSSSQDMIVAVKERP